MKKYMLMPATIGIYMAFGITHSFCQTIIAYEKPGMHAFRITNQNEAAVSTQTNKNHINYINIKVVRAFIKQFKNAEDVTWLKVHNGYVAQFKSDSIQTTVAYKENGSWGYTLKRYGEKQMPGDLRTLVKGTFFDFTIMEVAEILLPTDPDRVIYRILIKNADNFKVLRIIDNEITIINDYSNP